ncbi:MAG TPA: hypothetical protein VGH28_10215 [Polyangiaceae bacterium]
MSRRPIFFALLVAAGAAGACADILGIDDGTMRTADATVDAPADVTVDVAIDAPKDAAIEAATSPLTCGNATCIAPAQACCRTGDPTDASDQTFTCVAADAGCAGLRVTCDDTASCVGLGHPGTICCAEVEGGSIALDTACVAPGTCDGVVMCAPGDDELCANDAGAACGESSVTILGYTICR